MKAPRTHAPERGGGYIARTACGRDLNPSCGSHSSQPVLSSTPTCRACRRVIHPPVARFLALELTHEREARIAAGLHPTGNGSWRMPS